MSTAASARLHSVAELHRRVAAGDCPPIVDVRTPAEFAAAHIAGARNLPLGSAALARFAEDHARAAGEVFVICHSGGRSRRARDEFQRCGVIGAVSVEGGVGAWLEAGFPVVRAATTRRVISLERQVRIAAGTLVLAGAALGWTVHAGFYGLAAFVGAGLVFAGVTDFCGMGLLLARMPWNRR